MRVLQIHDKAHGIVERGTAHGIDGLCLEGGGGLAVYVAHLMRGLRERGSHVAVIGFDEGSATDDAVGSNGVYRLRGFRHRYRPSVARALANILDRESPDVVHLHSMPTLHPLLLRRLLQRCPVLWTFHDVTPLCFRHTKLRRDGRLCDQALGFGCVTGGCHRIGDSSNRLSESLRVLTHPIYLRTYRRARMILVPSSYLRDVFLVNGFDADQVRVIPLFSRFEGNEPSDRGDHDPTRILFVGRLTVEKGILAFLDALARLEGGKWAARVVGTGHQENAAREHATGLGLGDSVEFVGESNDEDLARQYRWCDLVVVPSLVPESFGLVGAEAMSFGKPVVAFESGGTTEWLEDEVNGCLVPHGDTAGLAERLVRLIRDPALCRRMGEAGRRAYQNRFTLDGHLDRMETLYRQVIHERGGARP